MSTGINTIVQGGGLLGSVYSLAQSPHGDKVNFGLSTGVFSGKTVVKSNVSSSKGGGIREALLKAFNAANITLEAKQLIRDILLPDAKTGKTVRNNAISGADVLRTFDIAANGFLHSSPKPQAQTSSVPLTKRTVQQVPASPQDVKLASEIVGYLSTKRFARPGGKPLLSPQETASLTNTLSRHGVLLKAFRQAVQTNNTAARDKLLRGMVTQFAAKSLFATAGKPPISRNSAFRMMATDMTNLAGELFGLTQNEKAKVWNALDRDFKLSQSNPEKAQRFLQNWEANYKAGKGHGLLAIVVNQTLGDGRATKGVLGQKPEPAPAFVKAAFGTAPKPAPKMSAKELFGFFGKETSVGFMKDAVVVDKTKKTGFMDDMAVIDDASDIPDPKVAELTKRSREVIDGYNAEIREVLNNL